MEAKIEKSTQTSEILFENHDFKKHFLIKKNILSYMKQYKLIEKQVSIVHESSI